MNMTSCAPAIADDVAVAVLAAGSAVRFGGGKLDAPFRGKPLGRWATDAVEAAGASSRFLIVGNNRPILAAALSSWTIAENRNADQGIGTSIHAAVNAAASFTRLIIVLADMPFITPAYLATLGRAERMTFTRHGDGRAGVPAAFPQTSFRHLLALLPTRGAADLAKSHRAAILSPCDPSFTDDIDTLADLERLDRSRA